MSNGYQVRRLMEKIRDVVGIAPERQNLVFGGNPIHEYEGFSLSDVGIRREATVEVSLRNN